MNLPKEWSDHIRRVKKFGGLDRGDTDEIVAAIEYFRDNLGANLKLNEHPIRNYLLLCSVPSLHFLEWLAGELRWITNQPRGANILSKLKNPRAFHPTVAEIETASRLREAGCGFDIEPEVEAGDGHKCPDFKTHSTESLPPCYVEVKHKRVAETTKRNNRTVIGLRLPRPPYSGACYQTMAPRRLKQVNKEIGALEQKVQETGEVQVFHMPNVIRLAVGPEGSKKKILEWASRYDLELNTLAGPSKQSDEVIRIKSAIKRKGSKGQLPDDYPGIIAIKNPSVFRHEQTVYETLIEVEEEMHRIPNLAFVLIHGTALNNSTPLYKYRAPAHSFAMRYQGHVYAEYFSRRHFMVDRVIVLQNEYCVFDNLFGTEAAPHLARSILTGYRPRPLPKARNVLSKEDFKCCFSG